MTEMIDLLRTRLQALKEELEMLQRQRQDIETRIADALELYEATQAVLRHDLKAQGLPDNTTELRPPVGPAIRGMTLKDAIYTIIKTHGGEHGIHVKNILGKLHEAGFPIKSHTPSTTIAATIYANTRDHGTYEKVAPNTFKLAQPQKRVVQQQCIAVQDG